MPIELTLRKPTVKPVMHEVLNSFQAWTHVVSLLTRIWTLHNFIFLNYALEMCEIGILVTLVIFVSF